MAPDDSDYKTYVRWANIVKNNYDNSDSVVYALLAIADRLDRLVQLQMKGRQP